MELIQILMVLFALFAFSRVVLRFRDKKLQKGEFIFWFFIWVAIIIFALLPSFSDFFAQLLGIGRGVDLFVYIGIIILFYLIFRLYVKMEKIEKDITKVVREEALKKK